MDRLLARTERPVRYIDSEWGARHARDAAYRVALVYPDTYELGMANQAIAILYARLNAIPGVAAERAYVPWRDMSASMRETGIRLSTLESGVPLAGCDLVGVTLPYELTYTNVLETLDLAGIPLRTAERAEGDPLVIGGGPCAYDPEPMAPFFDAILIGEGEEAIADIVAAHRAARAARLSRAETLDALARVRGVYVPSLYEGFAGAGDMPGIGAALVPRPGSSAPSVVEKRLLPVLDGSEPPVCPVVPYMEVVHDRANVEVLRGCARGCRFCQAGMVYRPVRERCADEIVRDALALLACTGYEEVSLSSLSSADHSGLEDVLRRLTRRLRGTATAISLPSLRVDAFSVRMAQLIGTGKKTGLTLAPEAGTQRLRDVINKNVTEEDLLGVVRTALESGWRRVKLYFMIGLPTETDDDVRAIGELVGRVLAEGKRAVPPQERGSLKLSVSVTTFVPKAHTPFQWEAQITREEALRRQAVLRDSMPGKGVDLSWHDAEVSFLEGALARGGRELADVIEEAWRRGAVFDAWTEEFSPRLWAEAFAACGTDPSAVANRERAEDETLPWDHVSPGVSKRFLSEERARSRAGRVTEDCTFGECTGCGVCPALSVENVIASGGPRARTGGRR